VEIRESRPLPLALFRNTESRFEASAVKIPQMPAWLRPRSGWPRSRLGKTVLIQEIGNVFRSCSCSR